jgi:predicted PurR-regulated permease PerM
MTSRIPATQTAQATFGVLLLGSIILVLVVLLPVWKPIFMAVVLAAALAPINEWFARKFGGRHRLASALTTFLLVVVILGPVSGISVVAVTEAIDALAYVRSTLEEGGIQGVIAWLPDSIESSLSSAIQWLSADSESLTARAMTGGQAAMGIFGSVLTGVTGMVFNLVLTLILFHTLLEHGDDLVAWILHVSPLPETKELLSEARRTSGFVLRSSFLTALVQGAVATIGFAIASVPNPVFFGTVALFAAFIPSIGTSLVTIPLIVLLALSGYIWQPIFLGVWAMLAIGLIDNMLNPLLIRDSVRLNGVLIFIALVGGMLVFGAIGLIIGPLAITLFLAMVRFAYRDYVERPAKAKAAIKKNAQPVEAGHSEVGAVVS